MQLGFVGLGKMGLNMVTRLERGGHDVVAYDRSADAVARAEAAGAQRRRRRSRRWSKALAPPRAVWVMVPAGDPHRIDGRRAGGAARRRATSSSTAATPTSTTTCGARRRWRPSSIALRRRRHERRHLGPDRKATA